MLSQGPDSTSLRALEVNLNATFEASSYSLTQVNNIMFLAERYMDASEDRLLKLAYDQGAFLLFKEQILPWLEKIGDLDTFEITHKNTLQRASFWAHIENVLNMILAKKYNINHLFAYLLKSSFLDGEIINLKNPRQALCWEIFKSELKDLLSPCVKKSKHPDFSRVDPLAAKRIVFSFIGQLSKLGFHEPAKAIHNLFYHLKKIVKNPCNTMEVNDVAILVVSVLLGGLKLEKSFFPWTKDNPSDVKLEWKFMQHIIQPLLEHPLFDSQYHPNQYSNYRQEAYNPRRKLQRRREAFSQEKEVPWLEKEKDLIKRVDRLSISSSSQSTPSDSHQCSKKRDADRIVYDENTLPIQRVTKMLPAYSNCKKKYNPSQETRKRNLKELGKKFSDKVQIHHQK